MIHRRFKKQLITFFAAIQIFSLAGCMTSPVTYQLPAIQMEQPAQNSIFDHYHSDFDGLLKKYVKNGLVDYGGIQQDPGFLAGYIASLAAVDRKTIDGWTENQQLAFWMNAYNAFTIQAIVERYPIRSRSMVGLFFPGNSILQISGVWSRLTFSAGGRYLTLGDIEHEILRKVFNEPRIHFAIVCASASCPVLRSEPYRYDVLDQQLHEQTVSFINDPIRGARYDARKNRIYVSKIFKWFSEDFAAEAESDANSIVTYVSRHYKDDELARAVAEGRDIGLSYLPYDWRLNEMVNTVEPAVNRRE